MERGNLGTDRSWQPHAGPRFGGTLVCCAIVIALQFGVVSLADAQFNPVRGREYREVINPVNPVRGEAVLGIAVIPADEAPRSQAIQVWIPEDFSGELEVETLSADGRFRGSGVFAGSTRGGQWVPLTLASTNATGGGAAPAQRPGTPATIALAVRGPGSTLLVARWGASPPQPPIRFRLYVNSRRADIFVRAGETVARCASLDIPQPLRFDTYCDLAASDVPADGRIALIRRDQFDEQTQTVTVNVRGIR